jgi:transposase
VVDPPSREGARRLGDSKSHRVQLGSLGGLTRYIEDLPIDNNWLFAGSLRAGQRAAVIMSLIQSAELNDRDPYRYLKDVLERLSTHPASRLEELLPHRWCRQPGAPRLA